MTSAIALEGVTKTFAPQRGVFDVTFSVEPGEIFGFLGPNGAGKTTLIRILLDYLRPEQGKASILGLDCQRHPVEIRRRLGYVPAEFRLEEHDSVLGYLSHLAGFRPPGALDRARVLAERLDLRLEGKIKTFSKGMKQKVALIQAMMHAPELLILDEPTEGLDPLIQHTLHALLREAAQAGTTVFFSSHILAEVDELCDRVAIIGRGQLLALERIAVLREKRRRILTLTFKEPVAADSLVLPHATLRRQEGPRAIFEYAGPPHELLQALMPLPLVDFSLEPAPLEDAFLEFYR